MAPLSLSKSRFRPPSPPPSVKSAASSAINQLGRLRLLVYILLGTSAAFGFGFMIWKLGTLFRQFTIGRILRERKPIEARYIKTWYGWIPQDRYDTRKQKWKNLYSAIKDWFSWDDHDDYSKIWWDSENGGDQIRCEKEPGSLRVRLRRTSLRNRDSAQTVIGLVSTERVVLGAPTAIGTYYISHRPSSAYFTYPLCLKPRNGVVTVDYHRELLVPGSGNVIRKGFQGDTFLDTRISMRKAMTRPIKGRNRQLNYLREWAARLEMGSLQSILSHQSGTLGRPGSPFIRLHSSSGSAQQPDSCGVFLSEILPLSEIDAGTNDHQRNSERLRSSPSDPTDRLQLDFKEIHPKPDKPFPQSRVGNKSDASDVERRFADTLDRHLEWLANECRPGQRGVKFPILPKNWLNNGKWLVHTNPCGASVEYMRRNAQGNIQADSYEVINRRATFTRRRVRAASVESWRAAINRARCDHNMAAVRSIEVFMSSTEDTPDTIIDTGNWMLRRPPQGFELPNRQKTAYWYGGIGKWARLEEWQAIPRVNDNPAGF